MWFSSWLRNRKRPVSPRRRPTFRPTLEALEGRLVLSTLTVTNNLDSGHGSLRFEIAHAKKNDTIVFAPSLAGQTITLTTGELDVTQNLSIQGGGLLTISGGFNSRVFEVDGATTNVALSGLTITHGNSNYSGVYADLNFRSGNEGLGGGICNFGTMTVSDCTVSGNSALYGGGIYNGGTMTVSSSSTVSGNYVPPSTYYNGLGGGIFNDNGGTLRVSGSTVSGNTALYGGGIYNVGTMTVSGSTVSGNSAYFGGGIYNVGTMTVSSSTVSGNSVDSAGWGDAWGTFGGLGGGIYNGGTMTVSGSTVSGNSLDYDGYSVGAFEGGGIYNANVGRLTVSGSTVSGNSASEGGGIYNEYHGTLTVSDSIFSGNGTYSGFFFFGPDILGIYTDGGGNTFS